MLKKDENIIDVKYIEGKFRYIENRWKLRKKEGGEKWDVEFLID